VGIPYTIGEWAHITLVHSGGVLRAYKNGVEVGNTPSGATQQLGGSPFLQIGGVIGSQNWSFEGQIDEVNIWNIARTPAEILQDLYQVYSGSETGLVAYYRMSDGSGTSLTDDSAASWTGTLFDGTGVVGNGPLWVASGAFDGQPAQVAVFDPSWAFPVIGIGLALFATGAKPNTKRLWRRRPSKR
jgi:hypothetical protein